MAKVKKAVKKSSTPVRATPSSSKKKVDLMEYGSIVFGLGILILIIAAVLPVFMTVSETVTQILAVTLIIIGLIIGYLNITNSEAIRFMVAMLLIVMLTQPFLGSIVQAFALQDNYSILKILGGLYMYINTLFVPAAIVVAVRTLIQTAKDEE